ncbi:hypothetical protein NQ317_011149 [Molorchus minor]|uniref:Uncharacterized protein n=1 Tax=Molorchus minor TaxID=1323400 RepID=A0ABQ9JEL8_9CUCU|nr:hypothetical protein NQ317_011149 [Molorchus minor]
MCPVETGINTSYFTFPKGGGPNTNTFNDPTLDLTLSIVNEKTLYGLQNKFDDDAVEENEVRVTNIQVLSNTVSHLVCKLPLNEKLKKVVQDNAKEMKTPSKELRRERVDYSPQTSQ